MRFRLRYALFALVLLLATPHLSRAQGTIDVRGVWARGNTLLVFANVQPCNSRYPPPGIAVLLISTDGGHTWKKGGIGLAGYEFGFISENEGKIWVAGEHTCEGPSTDPFMFVPVGENKWEFHIIGHGNETIDHLGWANSGELIAWITEIRLEDLEPGRTYVHQSRDGGRSWKQLGPVDNHEIPVQNKFLKITDHMQPLWRVVEMKDFSGFRVQHRQSEGSPWKTVSSFTPWRCPRAKSQRASK